MREDFTIVPRPDMDRYKWLKVTEALVETATTGMALRIPLNGEPYRRVSWALRRAINRRGLHYRAMQENGSLIAWAEEMPDEYLQRGLNEAE